VILLGRQLVAPLLVRLFYLLAHPRPPAFSFLPLTLRPIVLRNAKSVLAGTFARPRLNES
jgi:hypothetical protein